MEGCVTSGKRMLLVIRTLKQALEGPVPNAQGKPSLRGVEWLFGVHTADP